MFSTPIAKEASCDNNGSEKLVLSIERQRIIISLHNNENTLILKKMIEIDLHDKKQQEIIDFLNKIDELKLIYKHSHIEVITELYQFIPSSLFDANNIDLHHYFQFEQKNNQVLKYNRDTSNELICLYPISAGLLDGLKEVFPKTEIKSHIFNLIQNPILKLEPQILISIRNDGFDIIIFDRGKFQLINSIVYRQIDDCIYHILNICQRLNLDLTSIKVNIIGEIADRLIEDLKPYIQNIQSISIQIYENN